MIITKAKSSYRESFPLNMKKKIKSNFIIKCIVYPFDIMISIDQTDDELFKVIEKYGGTKEEYSEAWNMPSTTRGRCVMTENNRTLIRLKKLPIKSQLAGVISHEVFHAVTFIMDRIGMKLELMVSDEAYAYLTGYIIEEIYKELGI